MKQKKLALTKFKIRQFISSQMILGGHQNRDLSTYDELDDASTREDKGRSVRSNDQGGLDLPDCFSSIPLKDL